MSKPFAQGWSHLMRLARNPLHLRGLAVEYRVSEASFIFTNSDWASRQSTHWRDDTGSLVSRSSRSEDLEFRSGENDAIVSRGEGTRHCTGRPRGLWRSAVVAHFRVLPAIRPYQADR